jgi:hypothetical protein
MEHFVPLKHFPAGLTFPVEFQDRIRYDTARHRLIFNGFMRKTDYDTLARLSSDLEYLDALQHLFSDATFTTPRRIRWRNPALVATGLLLAGVLGTVWFWHSQHTKGTVTDGANPPAVQSQR